MHPVAKNQSNNVQDAQVKIVYAVHVYPGNFGHIKQDTD